MSTSKQPHLAFFLPALCLAACQTQGDLGEPEISGQVVAAARISAPAQIESELAPEAVAVSPAGQPMATSMQPASAPTPQALPLAESRDSDARESSLSLWDDATFTRRILESYASESEVEPSLMEDERKQMQKVLELLSDDKSEQAKQEVRAYCTEASSAVFDFTLGNLHFQDDELEPALLAYEKAVEKFPKFLRAWKNLGMIHVRREQFADSIEPLTRVIALGGGDGVSYGLLGFAYSSMENEISAESAYRMAVLLDPATIDWQMGLIRSFFRQQRFADASSLCSTMIRKSPGSTDIWLLQANSFLGMGKTMEAAQNFELVDGMGGSTQESLNTLGDIYVNEELFALASGAYLRALQFNPGAGAQRGIYGAQVLVARSADAGDLLNALDEVPGLPQEQRKDLLKLRSRVAVATGASEEEARILNEIVQLDPLDGEALLLLGQYHRLNEDPEMAIFYFERAASLEEFEADAKVRHAQVLVSMAKYAEALPLLRQAQAINSREHIQAYIDQVERIVKKN